MTEQEAIKNLTAFAYMECENMPKQVIQALDIAKVAIKEAQQYREIGTVEECREAVEKQRAKEPRMSDDLISRSALIESLVYCNGLGRKSCEAVLRTINEQPTAYDADEVVGQIENIMDDDSIRYCDQAVRRSVNIVREGGV